MKRITCKPENELIFNVSFRNGILSFSRFTDLKHYRTASNTLGGYFIGWSREMR